MTKSPQVSGYNAIAAVKLSNALAKLGSAKADASWAFQRDEQHLKGWHPVCKFVATRSCTV
jgi:hypothetical protein